MSSSNAGGDAFLNDDETMVHRSDCIGLSHGGVEAPARTRCESSAALLLCDAAEDFRRVMPTLVREQLQLAMHLPEGTSVLATLPGSIDNASLKRLSLALDMQCSTFMHYNRMYLRSCDAANV